MDDTQQPVDDDEMAADRVELAILAVSAELARIDTERDSMVARQHDLIAERYNMKPKIGLRRLGELARMSHQNIALVLERVPVK